MFPYSGVLFLKSNSIMSFLVYLSSFVHDFSSSISKKLINISKYRIKAIEIHSASLNVKVALLFETKKKKHSDS